MRSQSPRSALLVIDVQNDFCPGGSLAVPDGDRIIPVLNRYLEVFGNRGLPVLASRDWHPEQTRHFREFGGAWPPHCIRDGSGAAFHPLLRLPDKVIVVSKGMDPTTDDYSAFQGLNDSGMSLAAVLGHFGVRHLYVGGLATEYCVRETVLEGLRLGFNLVLLQDAVMGVNIRPGDADRAINEMKAAGAATATLDTITII